MSHIDVVAAERQPRVLDDYLDLGPFAGEVNRSPRTIRRWLHQPDGLPFSRIGNRILFMFRRPANGSLTRCVARTAEPANDRR